MTKKTLTVILELEVAEPFLRKHAQDMLRCAAWVDHVDRRTRYGLHELPKGVQVWGGRSFEGQRKRCMRSSQSQTCC